MRREHVLPRLMLWLLPLPTMAAACERDVRHRSPNGAAEDDAEAEVTEPAGVQIDDAMIADAVEHELRRDGAIPVGVHAQSRNGIVTVSGAVDNVLAAERAVRIAETVRGVRVVRNEIQVEAPPIADAALAKDVRAALEADAAVEDEDIEVDVDAGTVTLVGSVGSRARFEHAERVVAGVRGVGEVQNALAVAYDLRRSADEVLRDVYARLQWDAYVDHEGIDVEVEQGEVRLTGTVCSVAERRRAIADAWVSGVTTVDTRGLQVRPWSEREHERRSQPTITDARIADAIALAAIYDPHVEAGAITPWVGDGVVTLTGRVDSAKAKQAAGEIARGTLGVRGVANLVVVQPRRPVSDGRLARRIAAALERNAVTENWEIDVDVDDGVATLTGEVDGLTEVAEAIDVASEIEGVWWVDDELTVTDREPFVPDPYLRPYHPYVYPFGSPADEH